MAETKMSVKLISYSQLSKEFRESLVDNELQYSGGQAITLSAVRTCYSANKPSEIVELEGSKYFGESASDGKGGTEADRLFRHIMSSKHTSVNEHLSFTFAIEGISRSLLAQLTRHRVGFSFSVQSQRYVRLGSSDRSGGFDYVIPHTVTNDKIVPSNDDEDFYVELKADEIFEEAMRDAQYAYDRLRKAGVPAEDARAVLPNAAATNLVMTANLTALLSFYSKRRKGRGAQHEITELAEALRKTVTEVEPWTDAFFEGA
jgi:thymidylate synthase (FAD)